MTSQCYRPNGFGLRAADLVFGPTLACCGGGSPVPAADASGVRPSSTARGPHSPVAALPRVSGERGGQDLLLSRTMLGNHELPYVGRFACDWHRLATTDPHAAHPYGSEALRTFVLRPPLQRLARYGHDQAHAEHRCRRRQRRHLCPPRSARGEPERRTVMREQHPIWVPAP